MELVAGLHGAAYQGRQPRAQPHAAPTPQQHPSSGAVAIWLAGCSTAWGQPHPPCWLLVRVRSRAPALPAYLPDKPKLAPDSLMHSDTCPPRLHHAAGTRLSPWGCKHSHGAAPAALGVAKARVGMRQPSSPLGVQGTGQQCSVAGSAAGGCQWGGGKLAPLGAAASPSRALPW